MRLCCNIPGTSVHRNFNNLSYITRTRIQVVFCNYLLAVVVFLFMYLKLLSCFIYVFEVHAACVNATLQIPKKT